MVVNSINNSFTPRFLGENNLIREKEQKIKKEQETRKISVKKVSGLVLASALAAATLAGALVQGKMNKRVMNLEHELNNVRRPLQNQINQLTRENERLSNRLNGLLSSGEPPKNIEQIKAEVEAKPLGYDIMEPPVTGIKTNDSQMVSSETRYNLLPRVKTGNRANMTEIHIPEISSDGRFDFTIPKSSEIKISKAESIDFNPRHNFPTSVSESYSDSVRWDNDKIARDILQNFFDGHGQTLDGVRLKFEPTKDGRYRIRIEGDSTYTADKAIYMGESSKRGNANAAGNYGEGLKMAALKLLRDKGAKDVRIGSDNWDLTFKLSKDDLLKDKSVMAYDLDKRTFSQSGNYLEFETNDRALLETLRKSINRFYHSHNIHFKNPDYEDEFVGLKLLSNPDEKGAIYICGQRFEYNNDYDGLNGAILFLKEKPPKDVLDPSRDRTTLNKTDLGNIAKWIAKKMPSGSYGREKRLKFLHALEPHWRLQNPLYQTEMDYFTVEFANGEYYRSDNMLINFPKDKYVAYSMASPDVVQDLKNRGFIVCESRFSNLGMQTIKDLIGDARKHDPIRPTEVQIKKIKVLKEAIQKLAAGLKGEFDTKELNTKIFLFDSNSAKEKRMYENVQGEAIVDFGKSKGFWVDKSYFDKTGFCEMLETALHELCHKAGGDMSSEFSYKLTDVNAKVLEQIMGNPKVKSELEALSQLWNEYSKTTNAR